MRFAIPCLLVFGALGACTRPEPSASHALPGQRADALTLVAGDELRFEGRAAGLSEPALFEPARQVCTLRNASGADLRWTAETSATWLTFEGPTTGTLRPQASIVIGVTIEPGAADALPAGTHVAELRFQVPGEAGTLQRRRVLLERQAPAAGPAAAQASAAQAAGSTVAGTPVGRLAGSSTAEDAGWTRFEPSPDTRVIYVSSSGGDDRDDGFSPQTAKRTLSAGAALLRQRSADWLLLRRGDVWNEGLGQWRKSGRSPREPLLVATYGEALERPLLRTGKGKGLWTSAAHDAPPVVECVAFVGLHWQAHEFTGIGESVGIELLQPVRHLLIEDCAVEGYGTNLVFQGYGGRHSDLALRRSVIVDAFAVHGAGGHPEGLYAAEVDGLLLEENLFDHNGWHASLANAGPDMFSHNVYIDNGNTGVAVRGNIIANGASHGMQLRCGGLVVDNLFVRNSIALSVGGGNSPEPGGVTTEVRGNVILDGKDIDRANPRGWALWFANIASGQVTGNLVAHNPRSNLPFALTLDGDHVGDEHASIGIHDLRFSGNVFYDWGGGVLVEGDARQLTGIVLEGNDLQEPRPDLLVGFSDPAGVGGLRWSDNRCHGRRARDEASVRIGQDDLAHAQWPAALDDLASDATAVAYPEPQRDVSSYCHSLGRDATLEVFVEEARAQSKSRWRPEFTAAAVNAYMRGGFGLSD